MKSSRDTADRAIAHIKANPGATKRKICDVLRITADQFQAATPYIKSECERVRLEWRVKVEELEEEQIVDELSQSNSFPIKTKGKYDNG